MMCKECDLFESLGQDSMGEEGGRCEFDDLYVPAMGKCIRFTRKGENHDETIKIS